MCVELEEGVSRSTCSAVLGVFFGGGITGLTSFTDIRASHEYGQYSHEYEYDY